MAKVITGLYRNAPDAAAAVRRLEARGVDAQRISIVANESFDRESFVVDTHTKLPEGAAIGAGAGGAIGALVAGLTTVGAIASGGAGVLVAGPLVAALAGAGAGAAGGSVIGALVGLAIPEHELKHYEDAIREGSVLVGVECEEGERDSVRSVFEETKALKISHA